MSACACISSFIRVCVCVCVCECARERERERERSMPEHCERKTYCLPCKFICSQFVIYAAVCVTPCEGQAGAICYTADELGYLHMEHVASLSEIKKKEKSNCNYLDL